VVIRELRAHRDLDALDRLHDVDAKTLVEDVVIPRDLELRARDEIVVPLFELPRV
jgi:hypothetical protein